MASHLAQFKAAEDRCLEAEARCDAIEGRCEGLTGEAAHLRAQLVLQRQAAAVAEMEARQRWVPAGAVGELAGCVGDKAPSRCTSRYRHIYPCCTLQSLPLNTHVECCIRAVR